MPNRSLVNLKTGEYFLVSMDSKNLFKNKNDYKYFLSIIEGCMTNNREVEVLAYCLNANHFCLLFCEFIDGGIEKLMHTLIRYFNKYIFDTYEIDDKLSESLYEIKKVNDKDLLNTSCGIHKKADDWADCEYSSIRAYFYDDTPPFLNKKHIADIYGSAVDYQKLISKLD